MESLETKSSIQRSFETETPKNGSRDRDQVSRLHHCYACLAISETLNSKPQKIQTNRQCAI